MTQKRQENNSYTNVLHSSIHMGRCINLPREVNFEIWPQVKVITWLEKIMLHINRFVWTRRRHGRWSEGRSSSNQKVFLKNCWWPLMTSHDLECMLQRSLVKNIGWIFNHGILRRICQCIEWIDKGSSDFSHSFIMGGHKIGLTLGHEYKKIRD